MDLHLATFKCDVTPPMGHPLCGGWIKPATQVDDPLEMLGIVILGSGAPIVLATLDWTGLCNGAHHRWTAALADAAKTTPDRVSIHSVHQHNAPFVCLETDRLARAHGLPGMIDDGYFKGSIDASRKALAEGIARARPVSGVSVGQARVTQVASNRRLLGDDGRVKDWRGSSTKDARLHQSPEGLIDPWLRTVRWHDGPNVVATCCYYACHPMSYYGDGRVTSDFVGIARRRRQQETPNSLQMYFTGAAGNVAAGKYNDGTPEARARLTERIYSAMRRADEQAMDVPLSDVTWRRLPVLPSPLATPPSSELLAQVVDPKNSLANRSRPAFVMALRERLARKQALEISSLSLGKVRLLHLPAECFVEYQLRAQEMASDSIVCVAAYGDGGPWYIPTFDAYRQGGYEVSVAFCDPQIDPLLTQAIRTLLVG